MSILSPDGVVLGKGLVRYTSAEARKIAGHRSGEIEAILGYQGRAVVKWMDFRAGTFEEHGPTLWLTRGSMGLPRSVGSATALFSPG